MKKALLSIFITVLLISLVVLGLACKNETAVEVPVVEEETEQSEEAVEDEPEEETPAEETEEEAEDGEEIMEYSVDSKVGDLLDNPQTRAILEKYIPEVVNSDKINESLIYTLRMALRWYYSNVDNEVVTRIDEELRNLGSGSE